MIVDRVAVETSAQPIVHSTARHTAQGMRGHLARQLVARAMVPLPKVLDRQGSGELGGSPPSAVPPIVAAQDPLHSLVEDLRAQLTARPPRRDRKSVV